MSGYAQEYSQHSTPLRSRKQTAKEILRLCKVYSADLKTNGVEKNGKVIPFTSLSLEEYHDWVRRVPYREDKAPVEVVGRPVAILDRIQNGLGADCKKKAVLMASWFQQHGIPYRFIGSSIRLDKQIHHIFPQFFAGGDWINADATYRAYRIGDLKPVTNWEVLAK